MQMDDHPLFSMCCVHLAVLGAVGGSLASSAHEWLLQRLGAVVAPCGIAAVALGRCVLRPWHLESASARAAAGVIQIYSRPEYLWKLSIRNDSLTPSVTKGLDWPSTPPSQALWSQEGVYSDHESRSRTHTNRLKRSALKPLNDHGSAHGGGGLRQRRDQASGGRHTHGGQCGKTGPPQRV